MPTNPMTRRSILRTAATLAATTLAPTLHATPTKPIVLGHTYPASGIFADTAPDMKAAVDAAVIAANAAGGIAGRELRVVSLDDGFDPKRSLDNAERLRGQGAIALLAPIGTPVVDALTPWAERTRTPLIAARTGAEAARAYRRHVFFNFARFSDEVRHVARHLDTIGVRRVAVAAIDNPTGRDLAQRFAEAATQHRLDAVGVASFHPGGQDAPQAATRLLAAKPAAVLLAGGGQGAIEVVRHLLDGGLPAPSIYGLSLQQPMHLHGKIGPRSNGMVFTLVMPSLEVGRLSLVAQYREALKAIPNIAPSLIGLEIYLGTRIALHGLAQNLPEYNGAALAAALDRLGGFEIGGFRLRYDAGAHDGTHYVDLGILNEGRVTR